MPVYVVLGGEDSLAGGAAAADAARTHVPHATVRIWPGTTHSLPMQVPDALGHELLAFWDTVE
jgi:pimeloyl-ACP methyl ester carboxylesterase